MQNTSCLMALLIRCQFLRCKWVTLCWLFFIAIGVATLTAIAWTITVGLKLETLERVVTVLVIACPHALGLAVPLVVAISTTSAAQNGILIRNRLALEAAREIDVVIF